MGALALLVILGGAAAPGVCRPAGELPDLPSAPDPDDPPVRARLVVAPGPPVRAGDELWVGILLEQDEGWHTYWRNAGDAGLATAVSWELPEGFEVGPLVWPAPHRHLEAGDLVTFGYAEDVVLFSRLKIPPGATGSFELRGHVEWLMCRELCVPGDQDVSLRLTLGAQRPPLGEDEERAFRWSWDRIPRPAASLDDLSLRAFVDLDPVPPGQPAHAAVVIEGLEKPQDTEVDWFPHESPVILARYGAPLRHVDGARLLLGLSFEIEDTEPGPLDWGGVLVLRSGSQERFVEFDLPVRVGDGSAVPRAVQSQVFGLLLGGEAGGLFDQDFANAEGTSGGGSLLYYLLLALVGGVILNIMPCVLPVLSLKVMSFVAHAKEDRSVQLRLGLTFAAGVLTSFLALALAVIGLQAAGQQLGWGFQFQNPGFVVVMAAVVFAFGLSLFGVFEVILPLQFGGGGRGGAHAESFLNGVLATALATPCTAPFLGAALGFAFTQPPAAILAIFLTVGLGLSLPYVLLSLNPDWLRFVPKPGAWMDRFKQAMGFLLMATLVWLLWVLGQQTGQDGVIRVLAFLLVLGFGLWVYGSMLDLSSSGRRRLTVWALVLLLIGAGWWQFLRGGFGELPGADPAVAQAHGDTIPFSVERLENEVAAGNTVFVDFTAAWCTTCKVNEKTVLASTSVQDRMRELGVVTLVGDWTRRDETITRVLRQFGRSGVPFYAVFPAGRLDAPIVLPEVITPGLVLEALEKAGPSRTASSR